MGTIKQHQPGEPASSLPFELPSALEAREPPEARGLARDEVRLLLSYRRDNHIVHSRFREIAEFLQPGDLVVVNDSATLPAALTALGPDGTEVSLHFSTELEPDLWVVEPRQTVVHNGVEMSLPGGGHLNLLELYKRSPRLWVAHLKLPEPVPEYLQRWGKPVRYSYVDKAWPIECYQTIFASRAGSAEMPSAGRAFSERVLESLAPRGIKTTAITLHAGVASLEGDEPPYPERFEVTQVAADAVNKARGAGHIVLAVGTTVARALETGWNPLGHLEPRNGWTELVISPGRHLHSFDALLTGFHEPRATHFAILEAFAGRRHLEEAYAAALEGRYLWHEFGDLHLIL